MYEPKIWLSCSALGVRASTASNPRNYTSGDSTPLLWMIRATNYVCKCHFGFDVGIWLGRVLPIMCMNEWMKNAKCSPWKYIPCTNAFSTRNTRKCVPVQMHFRQEKPGKCVVSILSYSRCFVDYYPWTHMCCVLVVY